MSHRLRGIWSLKFSPFAMSETKRQAYYEMLHKLYGLTATQDDLLQWVKKQNLRVYSHDQRRKP
jgi:hypothetical protein